jgi:membrane-associated phospholipid phosphatase
MGKLTLLTASIVLAIVLPARAQSTAFDRVAPALPTHGTRVAADIASWATVLTALALDTHASWASDDRSRAFALQGTRVGLNIGLAELAKSLTHRARPCAPDCGTDKADASFYSMHTALAFQTLGGSRLSVMLPLSEGTGGLRIAAGKHWLSDVLVGAGVGALTSRIR